MNEQDREKDRIGELPMYPDRPVKINAVNREKFVEDIASYTGWLLLDDPDRLEFSASDVLKLLQHIEYLRPKDLYERLQEVLGETFEGGVK